MQKDLRRPLSAEVVVQRPYKGGHYVTTVETLSKTEKIVWRHKVGWVLQAL